MEEMYRGYTIKSEIDKQRNPRTGSQSGHTRTFYVVYDENETMIDAFRKLTEAREAVDEIIAEEQRFTYGSGTDVYGEDEEDD